MSERMSLAQLKALRGDGVATSLDRKIGKGKPSKRAFSESPQSKKKASNPLEKKQSKYKAKKVVINGISFDSKIEGQRYMFLMEQQKKGLISNLACQEVFDICVEGTSVCSYISDFTYNLSSGEKVVEDVKGMKTPVYRLKKKLLKVCSGIAIKEVNKTNVTKI